MAQASGGNAQITYIEETTWGQTPGSPAMTLIRAAGFGESLGSTTGELTSNAISGNRDVQDVKAGNIDAGGSIPFELAIDGVGTLLKHAIGSVTTTGVGPYTHTIKRDALPVGLTIEKGFTDINQYFVFTGCRINAMSVSLNPDGLVTGSFEIKAQDISASGTSLDASPTDPTFAVIAHHEATTIEEGASAATILGFEMSLTNNLDTEKYYVGSQNRASLPEGLGELTGTVTFMFEDLTYYNKWANGTETSLDVTFTQGSETLRIYLPRVVYTGDAAPKIESAQGVVISLNFRAIHDATENSDIVVEIVNAEATI